MSSESDKPYGRDAVVKALIESAADLFSKFGVDAISIRDIAARANVNHGLVHRHFGTKEVLRRKTQEHLAAVVRDEIGIPEDFQDALLRGFGALQRVPAFWRVLARTFLDGEDHSDVQGDFPFVAYLVAQVRQEQAEGNVNPELDARYLVAAVLAFGLGLLVFERFILPGTELDDTSSEEINRDMVNIFMSFIGATDSTEGMGQPRALAPDSESVTVEHRKK
jgi:AcrR family transcriptional regulator